MGVLNINNYIHYLNIIYIPTVHITIITNLILKATLHTISMEEEEEKNRRNQHVYAKLLEKL